MHPPLAFLSKSPGVPQGFPRHAQRRRGAASRRRVTWYAPREGPSKGLGLGALAPRSSPKTCERNSRKTVSPPLLQTLPAGKKRFGISFRGITRKSGSAITRVTSWKFISGNHQKRRVILEWRCVKRRPPFDHALWSGEVHGKRAVIIERTTGTNKGETEADRQSARQLLRDLRKYRLEMFWFCFLVWRSADLKLLCPHGGDIMGVNRCAAGCKTLLPAHQVNLAPQQTG